MRAGIPKGARGTPARPSVRRARASCAGVDNTTVLTTQLYFDDALSAAVYDDDSAYKDDADRGVFNESDGIFDETLLLALSREGDGYLGTISFDVSSI